MARGSCVNRENELSRTEKERVLERYVTQAIVIVVAILAKLDETTMTTEQ